MDGPVAIRLVSAAVTAVSIMFLGITICMASVPGSSRKGRDRPAGHADRSAGVHHVPPSRFTR